MTSKGREFKIKHEVIDAIVLRIEGYDANLEERH